MHKKLVAGLVGVLSAAGIAFAPVAAQASIAQCSTGYACLWGENDYSGCFYQSAVDRDGLPTWATCTGANANNGANSVRNEGQSCNVVFFDQTGRVGPGILFNRVADGYNFQDPYLGNGGGVGFNGGVATQNWNNRISSLDFCR